MKLEWTQAPVKTKWGDEMVVASVEIDKDHTVCLYCERDQTAKVEAMFTQRTWVGLTPEEVDSLANLKVDGAYLSVPDTIRQTDAKLKEKNT